MFEMLDMDDEVWYQQNDATMHRVNKSMNCLVAMLPGHFISHFVTLPGHVSIWTWQCLTSEDYISRPCTILELKESIIDRFKAIDIALL
jgi:hypothetical protein